MAVILETSLGSLTLDLFLEERPICCKNFLKLCKVKYFNMCLVHFVQRNFILQTGDPTATGRGGESIFSRLYGEQAKYFESEKVPKILHSKTGLLSMVNNGNGAHGSQFLITLSDNLESLDGKHTVFGEVSEGEEVLSKINESVVDEDFRPYRDIRIYHTVIIDDPYDDPDGLVVPSRSPTPTKEMLQSDRIGADEELDDDEGKTKEEIEEAVAERESKANAQILEIVGDIPDADIKPPDNVLFVCKLNPVTTDEDLEIIFSRFGNITSCEVIRDHKTKESLQFAFVEFEDPKDCETAYFKMDNVLIDDRRIHVDFSQSVSKVQWKGKGKGVIHKPEPEKQAPKFATKDKSRLGKEYDLVLSEEEDSSSHKKKKKRKRDKNYETQSRRERSRSREYRRKRSSSREHRRNRSRSREHKRGRSRSREQRRKRSNSREHRPDRSRGDRPRRDRSRDRERRSDHHRDRRDRR